MLELPTLARIFITNIFVFQISTESCVEHFAFWDGGEGEPIRIEHQQEQV